MSNVVNVVGRPRVEARRDLIRRALEPSSTDVSSTSIYVYKHSIVIDSSVSIPQPQTEAGAGTTYDINDKTPPPAVTGLFTRAPRWLVRQVGMYRKTPDERMLAPLCEAVRLQLAVELYPDLPPTQALRGGPSIVEVRPAVERELWRYAM